VLPSAPYTFILYGDKIMSSTIKQKWSLGFALLITAGVLQAASQEPIKKTYTLVNLQEAVYNSKK
jgi:hypothetical protein